MANLNIEALINELQQLQINLNQTNTQLDTTTQQLAQSSTEAAELRQEVSELRELLNNERNRSSNAGTNQAESSEPPRVYTGVTDSEGARIYIGDTVIVKTGSRGNFLRNRHFQRGDFAIVVGTTGTNGNTGNNDLRICLPENSRVRTVRAGYNVTLVETAQQ